MKKSFTLIALALFLLNCGHKAAFTDPVPEHSSFTIESEQLNESRVITVWTPPSYHDSDDKLPVLYMPDGGIKEDFPHVANTLNKLIANKSIPEIILVGIENTERGRDLTGFSDTENDAQYCPQTDGAKNFRAFITHELIPEIETNYKTNTYKGIIGESLAGLFVMETLMLEPETFDFYISIDPSLWWNDHYLVKNAEQLLGNSLDKPTKLWFAGSDAKDISLYTNQLAKILKETPIKNLHWLYSDEPKEHHHTIFRATKEKALTWSLN